MLKWATWRILVKIFHKASAIPSQPSKNTVEWFQTRWNQEKTNAQTPPKPVELLLSLHKELQGPGKGRALRELQVVLSPPQNWAWQRSNATRLVLSQTPFQGWHSPSGQEQLLADCSLCSAALPILPPGFGRHNKDGGEETSLLSFLHMGNWVRMQDRSPKQFLHYFVLPKELQKQFSLSDFCQRL